MSGLLLIHDSRCARGSEAGGRDLTPASFGQTPADIPGDASALLLRAVGGDGRAG